MCHSFVVLSWNPELGQDFTHLTRQVTSNVLPRVTVCVCVTEQVAVNVRIRCYRVYSFSQPAVCDSIFQPHTVHASFPSYSFAITLTLSFLSVFIFALWVFHTFSLSLNTYYLSFSFLPFTPHLPLTHALLSSSVISIPLINYFLMLSAWSYPSLPSPSFSLHLVFFTFSILPSSTISVSSRSSGCFFFQFLLWITGAALIKIFHTHLNWNLAISNAALLKHLHSEHIAWNLDAQKLWTVKKPNCLTFILHISVFYFF